MTDASQARKGDQLVLVGTRKGAFILSSDGARKDWAVSGPYWPGADVSHAVYDARQEGAVWLAIYGPVFGPELQRSHDLGASWQAPSESPKFAADKDLTLSRVWHLEPGREDEPEVVYAGVEPAALFKTEDGGETWREVDGLTSHPTRDRWQPGFGGLCLHSVVLDPTSLNRMWVGISAVGVLASEDGGTSWRTLNKGVRADFLPGRYPEFGQCPHKLLFHDARPQVLFQQNHCGVYRSDNGGEEWQDISEGLPSRFGFVLGLHSQDPKTIYVVPEDRALGDEVGGLRRYVTDARFRVYRSRNAGVDWEPLTNGLPQEDAYIHVMREGMATDSLDPCGVYIGTTTGQIFYSRNDGESWELMIDYLPPISSVACGIVT